MNTLLKQPEYIHTALNHFPLIGVFVALALLATALVMRHGVMTRTGLVFVCLLALSVYPVYAFGESGYDRVLSMADEPGAGFLKYHAAMAHRWVFLYYATAAAAAAALAISWKWPKVIPIAGVITLLLGVASLVAGIQIAEAGGKIRHREFRTGPPPVIQEETPDSH